MCSTDLEEYDRLRREFRELVLKPVIDVVFPIVLWQWCLNELNYGGYGDFMEARVLSGLDGEECRV